MISSTRKRFLCVAVLGCLVIAAFGLTESHRKASTPAEHIAAEVKGADAWYELARLDEYGHVPPDAVKRAQLQKLRMMGAGVLRPTTASPWVEQGPSNLAGRTCCLAINPTSPLTLLMGSAGGGVWRSYDGGTTWTPVGDQLKSLAVNALTLDPNNANTVYAGTGEGYFNSDAIQGFGIFKSTDGGTTWNQLAATNGFGHVNRIAVDPSNSQIIVASVEPGGIYRSINGGTTWTQVYAAQAGHAVAFCAASPTHIVASVLDTDTGGNWYAAALVSTNSGQTWSKATGGLGYLAGMNRIEPMPVPTSSTTVFASATDGNVWESTDGGASYTLVTSTGNSGATLSANAIWIDPSNSSRIVVGGQNVFESTDGGATLNLIGLGGVQTTQPHPGIHCIVGAAKYDGVTNKSVYFCTSGGVYQAIDITTANPGTGWLPHYQSARTSQFYSVAGDGPSGVILGGSQDNGTQLLQEGLFLGDYIEPGDGGFVVIDSTNPSNMYGEGGNLQVFQTTDGGLDVQAIVNGLTDAQSSNCNYIAPLVIDPNNSKMLLAGGSSLWRCTNAGSNAPTWNAIRPPDSAYITAVEVAPGNSDLIWVGQNDGAIAVSANGTSAKPSWTYVSGPKASSPIPNRYVTRILVDPTNSNVVYVSLGGFTADNLWETTDGGATWTAITGTGNGSLPQAPIRAIARMPGSPNSLYVGTEVGIFSTTNGGQTWTTTSDLDVNVSVDELTYMNNSTTLLAATHGRGIWLLPGGQPSITGLNLNPSTVQGGASATATILLSQVASGGGATVALTSSGADAQVPASVTVPAGANSATFTIKTNAVSGQETVSIQATLGQSQKTTGLVINPAALNTLTITPSTVIGGQSAMGTVTLSGVAPASGETILLSSNLNQATPPVSVQIAGGASSATFIVATSGVSTATATIITASLATQYMTADLTIEPAAIQGLSLSPSSVAGGANSIGTVVLNGSAPFGGAIVTLASNTKAATLPATVTIGSGANSATFTIKTSVVPTATTVTISAKYLTATKSATLQIGTTTVSSLALSASSVVGGSAPTVSGTVTLSGPAPAAGASVLLTCSNTKAATLPASVRVLAGSTTATFTVTHLKVTSVQTVTLHAAFGGVTQSAVLAVDPFVLADLSLTPTQVSGGVNSVGLVGLATAPGPRSGAILVSLKTSSSAIKIPATVTVPVGSTSAKFTITTTAVSTPTSVQITATCGASVEVATLSIVPPALVSVTINPSSVTKSKTALVTGTVKLSGPAPAGGTVVILSSTQTAASVPAGVVIKAGQTTATFKVTYTATTLGYQALITGSLAGVTEAASFTFTP